MKESSRLAQIEDDKKRRKLIQEKHDKRREREISERNTMMNNTFLALWETKRNVLSQRCNFLLQAVTGRKTTRRHTTSREPSLLNSVRVDIRRLTLVGWTPAPPTFDPTFTPPLPGKYLNKYDGHRALSGWDTWHRLVRNSRYLLLLLLLLLMLLLLLARFYNYTLNSVSTITAVRRIIFLTSSRTQVWTL